MTFQFTSPFPESKGFPSAFAFIDVEPYSGNEKPYRMIAYIPKYEPNNIRNWIGIPYRELYKPKDPKEQKEQNDHFEGGVKGKIFNGILCLVLYISLLKIHSVLIEILGVLFGENPKWFGDNEAKHAKLTAPFDLRWVIISEAATMSTVKAVGLATVSDGTKTDATKKVKALPGSVGLPIYRIPSITIYTHETFKAKLVYIATAGGEPVMPLPMACL